MRVFAASESGEFAFLSEKTFLSLKKAEGVGGGQPPTHLHTLQPLHKPCRPESRFDA